MEVKLKNQRRVITITGTSLIIINTVGSDTGQYQLKIHALTLSHMKSAEYDKYLLPYLENLPANAPATFLLQEHHLSVYDLQVLLVLS